MHGLRALILAASLLVFQGVAFAQTQEPTPQQFEAAMRWASNFQTLIQNLTAPLQSVPPPLVEDNRRERARWIASARAWANAFEAAIEAGRDQHRQLGPVPEAGELTAYFQTQEQVIPDLLDACAGLVLQYRRGIDAIERNDPGAMDLAYLSVIDAQILLQTQFRHVNSMQAEAADDGPQRYLLRSYASSYEAMIAMLQARRAEVLGDDIMRSSVLSMRAAANSMRQNSVIGRQRAEAAIAALPARVPPEQSGFLYRVRLAYQTFAGSFDREERIASIVDEIATSLERGADDVELDPILVEIGRLDTERAEDIRRRISLVQIVQPRT